MRHGKRFLVTFAFGSLVFLSVWVLNIHLVHLGSYIQPAQGTNVKAVAPLGPVVEVNMKKPRSISVLIADDHLIVREGLSRLSKTSPACRSWRKPVAGHKQSRE